MITARYIRPYETAAVPRYTPVGTVPVSGGEPDWSAEWTTGQGHDRGRAPESVREDERCAALARGTRRAGAPARGRRGG